MGIYEDALRAYHSVHNKKKFRIMEFDDVMMRRAAIGLDPMEALNFALGSKIMRSVLKRYKKEIDFLWVNLQEDDCVFQAKFLDKGEVYWKIATTRDILRRRLDSDFITLGKEKLETNRRYFTQDRHDKYVINSYCEDDISMCKKIVEVMLDVWVPKKLNYYISRPHNISYLLNNERLNQYDHLTFIVYFEVSDEEFRLFREKIRPKKELCFNFCDYTNKKHGCTVPFEYDRLEICTAVWFTRDDLFSMSCREAYIKEASFSNQDVNEFLKKWLSGNDTKLEQLKVEFSYRENNMFLDGIETKTLDQVRKFLKLQDYAFQFLDFQNEKYTGSIGNHMIRDDGKVATFYASNCNNTLTIYFHVWNKTNPRRIQIEGDMAVPFSWND